MTKLYNKKEIKERRRELRNKPTQAEAILWQNIKNGQLNGIKFRRQESIDNYITDFYSPSEKLVIELDGEPHFTEEGKEYDRKRTEYFNRIGLSEIRFENQEVLYNLEQVLKLIQQKFSKRKEI